VAVPPETLSTVCANTSEGIRCRFGGPVVPLVSTHSPDEPSLPTVRAPAPADSSRVTGSTAGGCRLTAMPAVPARRAASITGSVQSSRSAMTAASPSAVTSPAIAAGDWKE
jgi:hypothetical protein